MNSIVSTVLIGIGVFVVIGTIIDTIASEKEEKKNRVVSRRTGVVGVGNGRINKSDYKCNDFEENFEEDPFGDPYWDDPAYDIYDYYFDEDDDLYCDD